jgi:hypothetical protein
VGGKAHAGEVYRYTITPGGARRVTVTAREGRSQNSTGVPGVAEAGDRFGSVLALVGPGLGVLVGDPQEDVGSRSNAGAVWYLRVDGSGAAISSQVFSQDTAGVSGVAEAGDHFGASVSSLGTEAGIGVPGENDGSRVDSGMVQVMGRHRGDNLFHPGFPITQASAGVPGALEAGDRFGAQVVLGLELLCPESIDIAVGSPGEDVGEQADAGSITLLRETGPTDCPATVVRQGAGMAGAAETGDEVGSVLTLVRARPNCDEDCAEHLLVGVPKEDIGTKTDAGLVQPISGGIVANGVLSATLQYPGGYLLGNGYGMVLNSSSD